MYLLYPLTLTVPLYTPAYIPCLYPSMPLLVLPLYPCLFLHASSCTLSNPLLIFLHAPICTLFYPLHVYESFHNLNCPFLNVLHLYTPSLCTPAAFIHSKCSLYFLHTPAWSTCAPSCPPSKPLLVYLRSPCSCILSYYPSLVFPLYPMPLCFNYPSCSPSISVPVFPHFFMLTWNPLICSLPKSSSYLASIWIMLKSTPITFEFQSQTSVFQYHWTTVYSILFVSGHTKIWGASHCNSAWCLPGFYRPSCSKCTSVRCLRSRCCCCQQGVWGVTQGSYRSLKTSKVMVFYNFIFQARKVVGLKWAIKSYGIWHWSVVHNKLGREKGKTCR